MSQKDFIKRLAKDNVNSLEVLLKILKGLKTNYCLIDGMAINAYIAPLVSLDVDMVIDTDDVEAVVAEAQFRGFKVERLTDSLQLKHPNSDLRINIQLNPLYQNFIGRSEEKEVLGYRFRIARLEDVLRGKILSFQDTTRRPSKRQKDLADILRIVEAWPEMRALVPEELIK